MFKSTCAWVVDTLGLLVLKLRTEHPALQVNQRCMAAHVRLARLYVLYPIRSVSIDDTLYWFTEITML